MSLKDDARQQSIEIYPRSFSTRVLYSDMDAFRHVNSGAIGRYFEEGRAALNMEIFGVDSMIDPPGGLQLLFASVTLEFLSQAHYPGAVEVATGINRIGSSSFVLVQAAFQRGNCFAVAETVMVKAVDGQACSLGDAERETMQGLLLRHSMV
jgi:acyl-CoA thioester hydrolase